MSVKPRRRHVLRRLLLTALILSAAVYAGNRLLFRPPEQKDRPAPAESTQPEKLAESAASSSASAAETAEHLAQPVEDDSAHWERKDRFYTILVAGLDDGNGGSDTILLMAVDAENHAIYGVSIPRDTKAVINGKAWKINAAYNLGGMEQLSDTVSAQLGIPVDYTVAVNLRGFEQLVDAIGGVDFYVPVDMNYDDEVQNLSIHFSKGSQHLSGADALKVVRFRHNNDGTGYGSEDIGRMQTQQKFLKAVAKKMLNAANLTRIDDFVKIFRANVKTELSLENLAWLGREAVAIGAEGVDFSTLPGNWKSPYIYPDADAVLDLVNQHLNPYREDRRPEDLGLPG